MEKTLIIILWLENGRTMNLSIPNPRKDLTEAEVRTAVYRILQRSVILSENGVRANGFKHTYLRIVDEQLLP